MTQKSKNRNVPRPSFNIRQAEDMPREGVAICRDVERHLNWLLAMVHPDMYTNTAIVQETLRRKDETSVISEMWESVFPCITIISNGKTKNHRDSRGVVDCYDLLVSIGSAGDLVFELPELNTTLAYPPGTAIFLCGRGLMHGVPAWDRMKERCCWAHFIRDDHFKMKGLPHDFVHGKRWSRLQDFGRFTS
jgi:hypothetical protein